MMLSDLNVAGDFGATGRTTVIPVGTSSIPGRVSLVRRTIPAGATAFLELWSAQVVDIGNADQVYFAVMKNGAPVQAGMDRIPGTQFQYQPQIKLGLFMQPGEIEIIGFNISGMLTSIEPDAIAGAVPVNAQAWWSGSLLSDRGGVR
jgi:hypothetical protein